MRGEQQSKSFIASGSLNDLVARHAPNLRGTPCFMRVQTVAQPKTGRQVRPTAWQEMALILHQGIRASLDALPEYPGSVVTTTGNMGVMRKHLSVARLTYSI